MNFITDQGYVDLELNKFDFNNKIATLPVKIICHFRVPKKDFCLLCSKNIERQYRVYDEFGGRGATYNDAVYFFEYFFA